MSNVWPLTQPILFEIPSPLMNCIEGLNNYFNLKIFILDFTRYYSGKYTGRKLNWVLQMSRGEVISTSGTFANKYTFIVILKKSVKNFIYFSSVILNKFLY